jgi:hypothetical protein
MIGWCRRSGAVRDLAGARVPSLQEPGNVPPPDAQADCGMVRVAHARTTGNEARWRNVVDPTTPVLYQALETPRSTLP